MRTAFARVGEHRLCCFDIPFRISEPLIKSKLVKVELRRVEAQKCALQKSSALFLPSWDQVRSRAILPTSGNPERLKVCTGLCILKIPPGLKVCESLSSSSDFAVELKTVNTNSITSPLQQTPGNLVEPRDATHGAHCLRDQLAPIRGARTAESARLTRVSETCSGSTPVLKTITKFLTSLATSDVDDCTAGSSLKRRSSSRRKKQRRRVQFPSRCKVKERFKVLS